MAFKKTKTNIFIVTILFAFHKLPFQGEIPVFFHFPQGVALG